LRRQLHVLHGGFAGAPLHGAKPSGKRVSRKSHIYLSKPSPMSAQPKRASALGDGLKLKVILSRDMLLSHQSSPAATEFRGMSTAKRPARHLLSITVTELCPAAHVKRPILLVSPRKAAFTPTASLLHCSGLLSAI
jgi:hypothetical protein